MKFMYIANLSLTMIILKRKYFIGNDQYDDS